MTLTLNQKTSPWRERPHPLKLTLRLVLKQHRIIVVTSISMNAKKRQNLENFRLP